MQELVKNPKLKIPTECSGLMTKLIDHLSTTKISDNKTDIMTLMKLLLSSKNNATFLITSIKQHGLLQKYIEIVFTEDSNPILKMQFKLLSKMLNDKVLCELIISKHLSTITEHVKICCKKGADTNQWEGLYTFLKALAKSWEPIPLEKVRELWELILDCLCEKSKPSSFHANLAGILGNLSPSVLYPLIKYRHKEIISKIFVFIQNSKNTSINFAKLLKNIISLNDIATEVFLKLKGLDFIQNVMLPQWETYTYKILAELCAKPRFIDEILKTPLIKYLILTIRSPEEMKENNIEDEKRPGKYIKKKSLEEEKNIRKCIKYFEKIIKKAKTNQIEKFVELGALEALIKYLNPTEPALNLVYESISDILKEGRQWSSDRPNPIIEKAEALGLRRRIIQCTGQNVGVPEPH